jgi:hypothetical protein
MFKKLISGNQVWFDRGSAKRKANFFNSFVKLIVFEFLICFISGPIQVQILLVNEKREKNR